MPRRVSVVVRGAPRLLRTLGGWAWGYVAPSLGLGARRCWRRATSVGNQNRAFEGTVRQLAWLRDMTHSARTHSYHANLPLWPGRYTCMGHTYRLMEPFRSGAPFDVSLISMAIFERFLYPTRLRWARPQWRSTTSQLLAHVYGWGSGPG